jgi:hypothetical protein
MDPTSQRCESHPCTASAPGCTILHRGQQAFSQQPSYILPLPFALQLASRGRSRRRSASLLRSGALRGLEHHSPQSPPAGGG